MNHNHERVGIRTKAGVHSFKDQTKMFNVTGGGKKISQTTVTKHKPQLISRMILLMVEL